MFTRITLGLVVRLTLILAERTRRLRQQPDAGMETADKILWAAAITITVGAVGAVFKNKLQAFANNLSVTLGW